MREEFDVWVTKYALTTGILKKRVRLGLCSENIVTEHSTNYSYFKRDWHRDEESAIAKAEEMRVAKIESLGKQLVKYKGMTF